MPRKIGSGDRLSVTILFSVIAHGVRALGLTFEYEKPNPRLPSPDVILVQSASGEKPTKADFLAQANNSGGGESEKAVRPSELVASPISKNEPGAAPRGQGGRPPRSRSRPRNVSCSRSKNRISICRPSTKCRNNRRCRNRRC